MNNIQGKVKHNNINNNKYRRKYKYIKKIIKSLIIENAALCDEVAKIQESIIIVKDERKFLVRKLIEYEEMENQPTARNLPASHPTQNGTTAKIKKRRSPEGSGRSLSIT